MIGKSSTTYKTSLLDSFRYRLATELLEDSDEYRDNEFIDPDPVRWMSNHFYIPETNSPIPLHESQIIPLREALSRDENGLFRYSTILWGSNKKSAKSSIAAAVCLWMAWQKPWRSVKIVAHDLKQADSRVAFYARRACLLHPQWRNTVKLRNYKITLPNHSTIEAIPVDPDGEAGGNDDFVSYTEIWTWRGKAYERLWCYDDQTEFLTKRGWLKAVDVDQNNEIFATVVSGKHILQWETPKSYFHNHYTGKMHLYESERFSECVTPNHRLYGIFSNRGKKANHKHCGIMRSDDLRRSGYGSYYPLTSLNGYDSDCENKDIHISKTQSKAEYYLKWSDYCEYLGWYLSDGRIKHNGLLAYSVYICQSPTANPEKHKKIRDLHNRMFGDRWRLGSKDTDFIVDSAPLARLIKQSCGSGTFNKKIPDDIKNTDPDNLGKFLEAFLLGDGHCNQYGSWEIPAASKILADGVLEVCLKLGYTVSIDLFTPHRKGKDNWKPYYKIRARKNKDNYEHEVGKRYGHWKELDYDGMVFCPSTENGLLVVRRNGKIYVSGNTETTLSPTKYGQSLRWMDTYAGFAGESLVLERQYNAGVKEGVCINEEYEMYNNPASRLFALWNTKPRLPYQTKEYYAQEESTLVTSEFARVHKNEWQSSQSQFVPYEWWEACALEYPVPSANQACVVALDAAISGDCFGIVMVSSIPGLDGQYGVQYSQKWTPPKGEKLRFKGDDGPEDELRRLLNTYNIIEVAYDPFQLEDMASRLNVDLLARMYAFPQQNDRLLADKRLYDMIRERTIHHKSDPDLNDHIKNANQHQQGENKIRIVKRSELLKIDLAVSLSMALERAIFWQI